MASQIPNSILLSLILLFLISLVVSASCDESALGHQSELRSRVLLSFKEKPSGTNNTFDCSPNGPCISCLYSEKNVPRFRCSETGYRIPFKCGLVKEGTKVTKAIRKPTNDLATPEDNEAYITYRSCIPAVNEEKLSVLRFEVLMLGLLALSGSFVYWRKKQTAVVSASGAVRVPTSSRF